MGRPKKAPTLNDQLKGLISLALVECKNELAKDLIDILSRQQKADTDGIMVQIAKEAGNA